MKKRCFFVLVILGIILSNIYVPSNAHSLNLNQTDFIVLEENRIAGGDRYANAVAISRAGWRSSAHAVLAGGENSADVLCSTILAGKLAAPVLLTDRTELPETTKEELLRLKVEHVTIIGGQQAVGKNIEEDLRRLGIEKVERISGSDRFATSVEVAKKIDSAEGVVLASGYDCLDLLPLSSITACDGMPILYIGRDKPAEVVMDYLQETSFKTAYIVGRFTEINPELAKVTADTVFVAGHDCYATNAQVLKQFGSKWDFERIYAVSGCKNCAESEGESWTVSSLAARFGHPVILTNGTILPEVRDFLQKKISPVSKLITVGGSLEDAEKIQNEFQQLVAKQIDRFSSTSGRKKHSSGTGNSKEDSEDIKGPEVPDVHEDIGDPELPEESEDPKEHGELNSVKVLEVNSPTGSGFYKAGDLIEISVTFSDNVEVSGIPVLSLDTGKSPGMAVYSSGSGSSTLIFHYTVRQGDCTEKLAYTETKALKLNGGAILSAVSGAEAVLDLPNPGEHGSLSDNQDIVIDTTAPSALHISAQNIIYPGCSLIISAEGGPLSQESWTNILNELKANTGTGANWLNGIKAENLILNPSLDGASAVLTNTSLNKEARINADFEIPGSLIVDRAGNCADQTLVIDSHQAGVVKVYSLNLAKKQHKAGAVIWVEIEFNVPVQVISTHKPILFLETGQEGSNAVYEGFANGNSRILKFKYIVQPGDETSDLDYRSQDALKLNGARIKISGTSEDVNLTLPVPGSPGSLGYSSDISIDTSPPTDILISGQNRIPANSSVTLTVVEGPLSSFSWDKVFAKIQENTNAKDMWITGIEADDLTMLKAADLVSIELTNNSLEDAIINSDFLIPYEIVYDLAENFASEDIVIDAYKE